MKRNQLISQIAMLIIFLSGVLIMFYPFYINALNNLIDQVRMEKYLKKEESFFQNKRQELINRNNKLHPSNGLADSDPFLNQKNGEITEDYYQTHLIGTINIPRLTIELPLFDVTSDELLDRGATVVEGTSLPIGGNGSHAVVSAHSGLANRELFTNLHKLEKNDAFFLTVLGETFAYEVFKIKIVEPTDTSSLGIVPGEDWVTLITCTPYMINTHRLLVTGKRIPYTSEQKETKKRVNLFRNLKHIGFVLGIIFLVLLGAYRAHRLIQNGQV